MPRSHTLKSQLVREAFAENVDGVKRALPKPLRRGRRFIVKWGSVATVSLFFIALIIAMRLVPASGSTLSAPPNAVAQDITLTAPAPLADLSLTRPQRLSVGALGLGIHRIVIDAGHGGTSLGTSAATGLHEKDVTLDIADRLRRRLTTGGVTVLMTRQHDDTLSLQARSEFANNSRGDLFLSIHINSLPPDTRGVETYFLGPSATPSGDAVAVDENRDSGYSMADLRSLVDMIYTDARKDESRRFAASVHQALVRDLRRVNPELEDRGIKTAPFVVLAATHMPAILAEVSCLSNKDETALLSDPSYLQSIADALFEGIDTYIHHGEPKTHKEQRNGS